MSLQHFPEHHETLEQAIDLRLDIRNALIALGEFGAIVDHMREAETLATALDDQHRLGCQSHNVGPWDFLPFVNPNLSNFYPSCTTGSRCIRLAS